MIRSLCQTNVAFGYAVSLRQVQKSVVKQNWADGEFAAHRRRTEIILRLPSKGVCNISDGIVGHRSMNLFSYEFPWVVYKQPMLKHKARSRSGDYVSAEGHFLASDLKRVAGTHHQEGLFR